MNQNRSSGGGTWHATIVMFLSFGVYTGFVSGFGPFQPFQPFQPFSALDGFTHAAKSLKRQPEGHRALNQAAVRMPNRGETNATCPNKHLRDSTSVR